MRNGGGDNEVKLCRERSSSDVCNGAVERWMGWKKDYVHDEENNLVSDGLIVDSAALAARVAEGSEGYASPLTRDTPTIITRIRE